MEVEVDRDLDKLRIEQHEVRAVLDRQTEKGLSRLTSLLLGVRYLKIFSQRGGGGRGGEGITITQLKCSVSDHPAEDGGREIKIRFVGSEY